MVTKKEKPKDRRKRVSKKKKPKFNVLNFGFMKSVKERWRKPRGTANKKRRKKKWTGASPSIGYKNSAKTRGMRRDGKVEFLVRGMPDIEKLKEVKDRKNLVIRFSATIGRKKRTEMAAMAKEIGVGILNFKTG